MIQIRPMTLEDHGLVLALMAATPGVTVRNADSQAATQRYLERNPGLSFVAMDGERLVGCVMSGHDGRRGYLQHLVVHPEHRRQGTGRALVRECLAALLALGIRKAHIDVLCTNEAAQAYWASLGWQLRTDILRYSHIAGDDANA